MTNLNFNVLGMLIIKLTSVFVSFLIVPKLLILFGNKEMLGVFLTLVSSLAILQIIDFGAISALKNDMFFQHTLDSAKKRIKQTIYSLTVTLIAFLLICGLVFQLSHDQVPFNIDITIWSVDLVIFIILPITLLYYVRIVIAILDSQRLNAVSSFAQLFPNLVVLVLVLFLNAKSYSADPITIFSVHLFSSVIILALAPIAFIKKPFLVKEKGFTTATLKSIIFLGGLPFFTIQISIIFLYANNELILAVFGDFMSVSNYYIFSRPFLAITILFNVVSLPFWSSMRNEVVLMNYKSVNRLARKLYMLSLLFILVLLFLTLNFSWFMSFWLGYEFQSPGLFIMIFLFAIASLIIIQNAFSAFLNSMGHVIYQSYIFICGLCIKLTTLYVFFESSMFFNGVIISTALGLAFIVFSLGVKCWLVIKNEH